LRYSSIIWPPQVRIWARASAFLLFLCALLGTAVSLCAAQTDDVVCRGGSGNFAADFQGGVKVHVGAAKSGGLATRACEATINWGEDKVVVASGASEVDLDAFGVDLGMGTPVAAFQVRKSDSECCTTYLIYSLQKPPRLLRALTGGSSFKASDIDLDTRVELWTNDATAVDGFENLTVTELDFPPTVVLRFEHDRLLDVGSEFQPYFDHLIAKLREQLDPRSMKDFKDSDGKLLPSAASSAEAMHRLRRAKIAVLEIVWAYLYSGRERDAWSTLADMWPGSDLERIRGAIGKAHDRGILAQVDGVASAAPTRRKKRATIFDVTAAEGGRSEVAPPQPILLRRPPPLALDQGLNNAEILLDIVVDSAGKVRSAEPAGSAKSIDPDLIEAAMGWKFIPASSGGRAVASRTRLAVSARR